MRPLAFALLLASLPALAQSPSQRFQTAEQQYVSHRPDGLTWDDGTPEAAQALDAMWSAVTAEANNYLVAHPAATPAQLKTHLEQLIPARDPSVGNYLSASAAKLDEHLYVISFSDDTAGTVFVLRPRSGSPIAWRVNDASAQVKDTGNLLRAWRNSQADQKCEDREPHGLFATCGPIAGSVGSLPASATNAPRFYIEATYSKDAGASMMNQLSIWEWEGSAASLLWIGNYGIHAGSTRPVHVNDSSLTFGTQDGFNTFSSCMACDGRQLLHHLQLTPSGVTDGGVTALYPELDRVDALFVAFAKRQPYKALASDQVADTLRGSLQQAMAKAKNNLADLSVGMLEDWSVTRGVGSDENICITTGDLGRLDFTYDPAGKGFFKAVKRSNNTSKACPTKNALRKPYGSDE